MKILRRWSLMFALLLIVASIYTIYDYQFYVLCMMIGIGVGNLFDKDKD